MIELLARETRFKWVIHGDTQAPYGLGHNYNYAVETFGDGFKLRWANMFVDLSSDNVMTFEQLAEKINSLEGAITAR